MTLEMALKEQFQAGEAKGHEAGLAEGRSEGRTEGIEDSIAIIQDLKNGMSVEQTAQKYQIDIEKVQAFAGEINIK